MQKLIQKIDRLHWLWLGLASPFLLFPSPTHGLAMLVIPVLFLVHLLAEKEERSHYSCSSPSETKKKISSFTSDAIEWCDLTLIHYGSDQFMGNF